MAALMKLPARLLCAAYPALVRGSAHDFKLLVFCEGYHSAVVGIGAFRQDDHGMQFVHRGGQGREMPDGGVHLH